MHEQAFKLLRYASVLGAVNQGTGNRMEGWPDADQLDVPQCGTGG